MRDPKRIPKILKAIEKVWEKYPDMRLGQLIANVVDESAIYFVEDEDLIDELKKVYKPKTKESFIVKQEGYHVIIKFDPGCGGCKYCSHFQERINGASVNSPCCNCIYNKKEC